MPGIIEAINFLSVKYDLNKFIGKSNDTIIETNQFDLINESINLINEEFKNLDSQNQKFLAFYIHPKNNSSINKYIFNELNSKITIINLKKYIKKNMYYDKIHLNELGHKKVAEIVNIELKNFIKNN